MNEDALSNLGRTIGLSLNGGEVLELVGDVGAGKTTLTKSIARGMGITETIQSPTFTISNRYTSPDGLTLVHYDFYRLKDAGIMREELAETLHGDKTVTVIEWGDIIEDVLPSDRLTIRLIPISEDERKVEIEARGAHSSVLKEAIS